MKCILLWRQIKALFPAGPSWGHRGLHTESETSSPSSPPLSLTLCFSPLPAPPLIPQVKDCQVESVCVVCVCRGEAVGVKAVKRACERKEHLFFSMRPPFSPHALATHLTPPSLLKRGVRQPPRPLCHGWCSGATHTWCALWLTFHWVKCISSSETKTELITSGDERFTV